MIDRGFQNRNTRLGDRPRKVRGGLRLGAHDWPLTGLHWAGARWAQAVEQASDPFVVEEGLAYAREGQTRSLEISPGAVRASVQGRAPAAYRVAIRVRRIGADAWDRALKSMADQAVYSAKLLAGELPESLDELFTSAGAGLLPLPGDLAPECICPDSRAADGAPRWCKHAVCAALLVAELFDRDPFLAFTLRGMKGPELIERLRGVRTFGGVPLQSARPVPPEVEIEGPPLEACLDDFWSAGPGLKLVETPVRPPEVTHALLRRLGPSPFPEAKFPLVGLLATCYDVVTQRVLEQQRSGAATDPEEDAQGDDGTTAA